MNVLERAVWLAQVKEAYADHENAEAIIRVATAITEDADDDDCFVRKGAIYRMGFPGRRP